MIKYKLSCGKITSVEVLRETEKQVVIEYKRSDGLQQQRRENKICDFYTYHDTWGDAHNFLLAEVKKEIKSLRATFEHTKGRLLKIVCMKSQFVELDEKK